MTEKSKFNFTEGYKELENLVTDFESRDLDLEQDLPKFERGMDLARKLQIRLKEIENTVIEITNSFQADEKE